MSWEQDEETAFAKWIGLGYTADFYDGAAQAWGEQAKRKEEIREALRRLCKRLREIEPHVNAMTTVMPKSLRDVIRQVHGTPYDDDGPNWKTELEHAERLLGIEKTGVPKT